MPEWLQGDVLDVRMAVTEWLDYRKSKGVSHRNAISHHVSSLAETLRWQYGHHLLSFPDLRLMRIFVRHGKASAVLLTSLPS